METIELTNIKLFDVELGDAIYIRLQYKNGAKRFYLIDGGFAKYGSLIADYIKQDTENPENILDGIIITHYHADHIAGTLAVIKDRQLNIKAILVHNIHESNSKAVLGWYKACQEAALDGRGIVLHIMNGCNTIKDDFPEFEFLYPDIVDIQSDDPNKNSIITILNINDKEILFTGDAYKKQEKIALLKAGDKDKHCENIMVWKLGHHGSSTSTRIEVLKRLSGSLKLIAISCSDIQDKFPHKQTKENIHKYAGKTEVMCTFDGEKEFDEIEGVKIEVGCKL